MINHIGTEGLRDPRGTSSTLIFEGKFFPLPFRSYRPWPSLFLRIQQPGLAETQHIWRERQVQSAFINLRKDWREELFVLV